MKAGERFVRIKGFEEEYLISNYGRVVRIFMNGKFKEKKQLKNHNGYYRVGLWKNNKRSMFRIHRLMAEHFIENDDPNFKMDVHHKDRDKKNNKAENLEWCTHNQNLEWYHHQEVNIA